MEATLAGQVAWSKAEGLSEVLSTSPFLWVTLTRPFPPAVLSLLTCEMGIWLLLLRGVLQGLAAALPSKYSGLGRPGGWQRAASWRAGPGHSRSTIVGSGGTLPGTGGSRWMSSLPGSFSSPEN